MKKIFKALRDKIVVRVLTDAELEQKQGMFIIATDTSIDENFRLEAVILDVGNAIFADTGKEDVKVGDRVAIARGAGIILVPGSEHVGAIKAVRDIDILAKIEVTQEELSV